VTFIPFDDKVKLKEAWDLSVDVPRWFNVTVDTIGGKDSAVAPAPFDSVLRFMKDNQWGRDDCLNPKVMQKLGIAFDSKIIITGTVKTFIVVKRAINTDGDVVVSHGGLSGTNPGSASTPVLGGIQSYNAKIIIIIDIYDALTGKVLEHVNCNSEQKDNGLKMWVPMQGQNAELDFDNLSSTPFGSEPFCRTVAGVLMKSYSAKLQQKILTVISKIQTTDAQVPKKTEFLEGKILEINGSEAYINLGREDQLYKGEIFEILKPDHPILSDKGDTLGWVEIPYAQFKIRSVKSTHFSSGIIFEAQDSVKAGWTVRSKETALK